MKDARRVVPVRLRSFGRKSLNPLVRRLKCPRMLWGHLDASGAWRERTRMSDTSLIYHPERVSIDDNVFVGHFTILDGTGGLEIGEGTQISARACVLTHSSHKAIRLYGKHYVEVPEAEKKGYEVEHVAIGRYVFIGVGALILPGVTVGSGSLIAAGSIVTRDVGAFEIVSGNPATVVGDTRNLDKDYLEDPRLSGWYNEWQDT